MKQATRTCLMAYIMIAIAIALFWDAIVASITALLGIPLPFIGLFAIGLFIFLVCFVALSLCHASNGSME